MLSYLMISLAAVLMGCSGGDDTSEPVVPVITTSVETVNAPAAGGVYDITVTTTGQEWGAYTEGDFVKASVQYSSNSVVVTIDSNPNTTERIGSVIIMSGTARKTVSITQAAAEKPAYNAPDGYTLVWQDEFESGSELNAADWTHEVKNSGWVNHELQNYVNHKTPDGALVTQVKNGTLRITAMKENGKIYSGRVYAKVKQGWQYGYIEASIKLPKGKGTWPTTYRRVCTPMRMFTLTTHRLPMR